MDGAVPSPELIVVKPELPSLTETESNNGTHKDIVKIEVKVEETDEWSEQEDDGRRSPLDDAAERAPASDDIDARDIKDIEYEYDESGRVKCPKCEKDFKNKENLKRHLMYVHANETDSVECNLCFRTFKSKIHLRDHKHSVHFEAQELPCAHCDKTFLSKKKLDNHIFYAHPKTLNEVTCKVCNKVFKGHLHLKIHMRQVHPDQTERVACDICGKSFKNKMLLRRHMGWSHPQDGMMYRCPVCSRTLPSMSCFQGHMKNVHSEGQVTCQICQKPFKTRHNLERHEKAVHLGLKTSPSLGSKTNVPCEYKCTECPKSYATMTALQWHFEKTHTGDNKTAHSCHICMKELSDAASVRRHIEMCHSEQWVKCEICQKEFKSTFNLERHIKVTHAAPDQEQTCEICQKTFKCLMHLRIHMNAVHSTKGTQTCDICNKEFSSKKYMMKHRKTHVASKDQPCDICHKYFKSITDVNKHKKRVHASVSSGDSLFPTSP